MSARAGRTASLLACLTLGSALSVSVSPVHVAGADDPVATVDELLDAAAAGDAAAVDALVCDARRQPVPLVRDVLAAGQDLDTDVALIRDAGGWLICGGFGRARRAG